MTSGRFVDDPKSLPLFAQPAAEVAAATPRHAGSVLRMPLAPPQAAAEGVD